MRIILINIAVTFSLLAVCEFGFRLVSGIKNCVTGVCNFYYLTKFNAVNHTPGFHLNNVGLINEHPILGFSLTPNFSQKVTTKKDWFISINKYGLRNNGNEHKIEDIKDYKIMVVGDSYAFGANVDDRDTWPSCLEKSTNLSVANGGVFNYGTAQAVIAAEELIKKKMAPSYIILSTLVGHNLNRDVLRFRNGYPMPALKTLNNEIVELPPLLGMKGSLFNQDKSKNFLGYSAIYTYLYTRNPDILPDPYGYRLHRKVNTPPTDQQLMSYILERINKIQGPKKILLLQYSGKSIDSEAVGKKRKLWASTVSNFSDIQLIDTFDLVKSEPTDKVWFSFGHHTTLGNNLVCQKLIKNLPLD